MKQVQLILELLYCILQGQKSSTAGTLKGSLKFIIVKRFSVKTLKNTLYCFATHLWPDGVLDPDHADGGEVIQNVVLVLPVGLGVAAEVPVRHANGPQAVARHGLDHLLHHLVLVPRPEHPGLAHLAQDVAAPAGAEESRVCWFRGDGEPFI